LSLISTPLSHPQQDSSSVPPPDTPPIATKAATAQTSAATSGLAAIDPATGANVTEGELRQALAGQHFFLRGLWLSDDLHFGLAGALIGQSAHGSFTLCDVEIDKVRQAPAFDRIRVTPQQGSRSGRESVCKSLHSLLGAVAHPTVAGIESVDDFPQSDFHGGVFGPRLGLGGEVAGVEEACVDAAGDGEGRDAGGAFERDAGSLIVLLVEHGES
jgi:hypothetical protein